MTLLTPQLLQYFKMNEVMNYAISVPYSKVRANEVMLVWEMNGEPLPKIHGAPVRAVVMGYIGARSVKWLYRVTAIREPTRAPVQSREYLYFNQQVGKHNQRWTDGIQIQEMPVSSAIVSHAFHFSYLGGDVRTVIDVLKHLVSFPRK